MGLSTKISVIDASVVGINGRAQTPRGHPVRHKRLSVLLYCHGISMNVISKFFDVSVPAVLKWIRAFAKKQAPNPHFHPAPLLS